MSALDPDENEISRTLGYTLGISAGWGEAAHLLATRAAAAFVQGDDSKASLLRALSKEMRDLFAERRAYYDTLVRESEQRKKTLDTAPLKR